MKSKKVLTLVLAFVLCAPALVFAGNKKEAAKKIDALNQQIAQAAKDRDLQRGIDAAEEAFEISSREFGKDSKEASSAMINLANLYMYADDPAGAENLLKKAILNMSVKDMRSLDVADAYFNLSMAYAMQKKYDEASKCMNLVLQIRTEKLGRDHEETLKAQKMFDQLIHEQ